MSEQHPVLAAIDERRDRIIESRDDLVEQAAEIGKEIDSIEAELRVLSEAEATVRGGISDDAAQETAGPEDPPTPGPAEPAPDEGPEEPDVEEAPVEADEPPPEPAPKRVFGENGGGPSGGQRSSRRSPPASACPSCRPA